MNPPDKTLAVQLQIRQNADEISAALQEVKKWETKIKGKEEKSRAAGGAGRGAPKTRKAGGTVPLRSFTPATSSSTSSTPLLTPATLPSLPSSSPTPTAVPKALGRYEAVDVEEAERERGNAEFKAGNFAAAIKSYTKCLGMKARDKPTLRSYPILPILTPSPSSPLLFFSSL